MIRKDVSGGQRSKSKNPKNDEKRRFRRSKVKVQKIRKNDKKRRFRRSKVKVQKLRKNDEKRRFRRSKVKVQKIRFLLNAMKNEENARK
jgi:hypothetical protein